MYIDDFLRLLEPNHKRRDGQGNYICRCPAHDDSTESLHVKLGRNKKGQDIILIKCLAGCTREDILQRMGLEQKDLTCGQDDDRPPWDERQVKTGTPTWEKRKKPEADKPPKEPPKKADHGAKKLECTYPYTDEEGRLLFEAVRYRYEDGSKTFRQRRPDPEHPGQWKWELNGVRLVLYRLPEVRKAIAAGQPVWLAEGEKDADNLAGIGLCGTTLPMGAGKDRWSKSNYADSLKGATVYILPDNDKPGWEHAQEGARTLDGAAAHCRILDLKRIWPEIPEKNDVSDLIAHLGGEKAKEALLALAADNRMQYGDVAELYGKIPGYTALGGCICQATDSGAKMLCNFLALPVEILSMDDGLTVQKRMKIRGWTAKGKELRPALVPVGQYNSMSWVGENWDIAANMVPGNTTKDKLRYVIAEVGRMTVERRTEYTHTGWRQIGGKWAYLHGGGAIGADNVSTVLEGPLAQYRIDGQGHTAREGFEKSMGLRQVMSEHAAIPLLACMYLAPLRSFLTAAGIPPGFAAFFAGKGGTGKTTAVTLALSHFGLFTNKTPTASFHDTSNSVRKKAFTLQDMPLLVDDYHPTSSQQEKRKMESMAQDLARAFGDMADRGRMNADRTLQTAMPPRCLAIMTGEDMPQIGESGLARFFTVRLQRDDIYMGEGLTQAQEDAAQGYLMASMAGYIEWLRRRADSLSGNLKTEWMKLRGQARGKLPKGSHARGVEALAHLMLGWEMLLMYGYSLGALDQDAVGREIARGWRTLTESGEQQTREAQEDTPTEAFMDCIKELMATKTAYTADIAADPNTPGAGGPGMIGYRDTQYYMLLPDLCYRAVNEIYIRQGTQFPLSKRGLLRALKEAGITIGDGDGVTKTKYVGGKSLRLLWIPRHRIDGGDPPPEQQGFLQVDDPDDPFNQ